MENQIRKIIADHLGLELDAVVDAANFMDDLGADSLDTVEPVLSMEEEFGIEIPDEDAENLLTVGDLVGYITENT